MSKGFTDLTGKQFDHLTVIKHDHVNTKRGAHYWLCRCDCGKEVVVEGSKLTCGKTRSCGHLRKDNQSQRSSRIDETGNRYGELTVICYDHSTSKGTYWKCRCSCGKEVVVRGNDLRHGRAKSCGHVRVENARKATFKDITGQRFNDLEVVCLDHIGQGTQREAYWKCRCLKKHGHSVCGKEFVTRGSSIRTGKTKCCPDCAYTTHGYSSHPLYQVHQGMLKRCHDPNHDSYASYGARGITVCPEWDNWNVPEEEVRRRGNPWLVNFIEWSLYECDEPWKPGYQLDRRDNEHGNYDKIQCHYVAPTVNQRNKRDNMCINDGEETLTWSAFSEKYNLSKMFVENKVQAHWSLDEIVYAAKHPELGMNRRLEDGSGNKVLRDRDGFMHLIPRNDQPDNTKAKEHRINSRNKS